MPGLSFSKKGMSILQEQFISIFLGPWSSLLKLNALIVQIFWLSFHISVFMPINQFDEFLCLGHQRKVLGRGKGQ